MIQRAKSSVLLGVVSLAACSAQAASLGSTSPEPPAQQETKAEKKWTQTELEAVTREISGHIEELRGEKFLRPVAVRVSTKEALIEYLKQREEKTETPEKLAADERIGKMLGVVAPDLDLRKTAYALLEAQVAGFYDPDTDAFSLMETLPLALTKITLAHELVHGLDDQLFDIDGHIAKLGTDTDVQLAFQAVVEGSATAVMTQWALSHPESMDLSALSEKDMQQMTSLAGAPEWMWKPMIACYMAGSGFLHRTEAWLMSQAKPVDGADIRAAFETPPRSTEQILHPDKYWKSGERDDPRRVAFDTSKLPEGWKVLREDTLGELMIGIVTLPDERRDELDLTNPTAILGVTFTQDVARGWGGDRLALLGNGDAYLLRWASVWDSERDAAEFYGAMTQCVPALEDAARALAGGDPKDCGVTLEYGDSHDEVLLTSRIHVSKGELKRVLRELKHSLPKSD